jgi:hypothetical protein
MGQRSATHQRHAPKKIKVFCFFSSEKKNPYFFLEFQKA